MNDFFIHYFILVEKRVEFNNHLMISNLINYAERQIFFLPDLVYHFHYVSILNTGYFKYFYDVVNTQYFNFLMFCFTFFMLLLVTLLNLFLYYRILLISDI